MHKKVEKNQVLQLNLNLSFSGCKIKNRWSLRIYPSEFTLVFGVPLTAGVLNPTLKVS